LKGHISSGGCKFGPIIGGTSILYNDRVLAAPVRQASNLIRSPGYSYGIRHESRSTVA